MKFESPVESDRDADMVSPPTPSPKKEAPTPSRISSMSPSPSMDSRPRRLAIEAMAGDANAHRSLSRCRSFSSDVSLDQSTLSRLRKCLEGPKTHLAAPRAASGLRTEGINPTKTREEMRRMIVMNRRRDAERALATRETANQLERLFRVEARKVAGKPVYSRLGGSPPAAMEKPSNGRLSQIYVPNRRPMAAVQEPLSMPQSSPRKPAMDVAKATLAKAIATYLDANRCSSPSGQGDGLLTNEAVVSYFAMPAFMRPLIQTRLSEPASRPLSVGSALEAHRRERWKDDSEVAFRRAQSHFA